MNGNVKELLDCVTRFYLSMSWIRKDCDTEWRKLNRKLSVLKTFDELIQAYEVIDRLMIGYHLFTIHPAHVKGSYTLYWGKTDITNPIERTRDMVGKVIPITFWIKISKLETEEEYGEVQAKFQAMLLVNKIPAIARDLIRRTEPINNDSALFKFTLRYLDGQKNAA